MLWYKQWNIQRVVLKNVQPQRKVYLPKGHAKAKFLQKILRTFHCSEDFSDKKKRMGPKVAKGQLWTLIWFSIDKSDSVKSRLLWSTPTKVCYILQCWICYTLPNIVNVSRCKSTIAVHFLELTQRWHKFATQSESMSKHTSVLHFTKQIYLESRLIRYTV